MHCVWCLTDLLTVLIFFQQQSLVIYNWKENTQQPLIGHAKAVNRVVKRREHHAICTNMSSCHVVCGGDYMSSSQLSPLSPLNTAHTISLTTSDIHLFSLIFLSSLPMLHTSPLKVGSKRNASSVFSTSRDLTIKQWKQDTGECVQTLSDAHTLNIPGTSHEKT